MSLLSSTLRIIRRSLNTSSALCGMDSREKRLGHIKKSDRIEGEYSAFASNKQSLELVDENLMERVFGHTKFKDLHIMLIRCTRNNTKICVTRGDGSPLVVRSAGTEGFKHCRKGTTVAAQAVANRIVTFTKDHGLTDFRLVFNGLGPGRDAAYKVIELSGLNIISLSDRTEAIEPWVKRPRKAKRI